MTLVEQRAPAVSTAPPTASAPAATPAPAAPVGPRIALSLALAAVLIVGFGAYLLGLSRLSEQRAQHNLLASFTKALGEATAPVGPATEGNPVAVLDIPAIRIHNLVVVEGSTSRDLMSGPGHLPATVLPGQDGVSTILGKRDTFGAPFRSLLDLQPGDQITVLTGQGTFHYTVSSFGDDQRPAPANSADRLLLETAEAGWAPQRTVMVSADLVGSTQPAPGGRPGGIPTMSPMSRDPDGSLIPLAGWSQVLLLLAVVGTVLVTRGPRWPVALCVSATAVAVLWNVYESAAGLLPNIV